MQYFILSWYSLVVELNYFAKLTVDLCSFRPCWIIQQVNSLWRGPDVNTAMKNLWSDQKQCKVNYGHGSRSALFLQDISACEAVSTSGWTENLS